MLKEISQVQQILWTVNLAVGAMLLALLAIRKNYRAFPAFSLYVLLNLALGILAFAVYRRWGFFSQSSWTIAWGMQALALCARAVAVAEVCKHLLSRYRGVWAFAWRVMAACAALVLVYSGLAARRGLGYVLPTAARGLELAIAAMIVALFLFVRHYGVEVNPADRSIALGFCLYSCFTVLNYTLLNHFPNDYVTLWNSLGMLAYLGGLLLWSWALHKPYGGAGVVDSLLPASVYQSLAPQINLRLRLLNDQLNQLWKPEVNKH